MDQTLDFSRIGKSMYDAIWTKAGGSAYSMGGLDKVEPNMPMKLDPLKVGSLGDVKVDDEVIGLEDNSMITTTCREVDAAFYKAMCPWYSTGSVSLVPAVPNTRLYQYAGVLTLHPRGDSGTNNDINLLKAVPLRAFFTTDGKAQKIVTIQFSIYPDRSQLPNLVYGYVGSIPA
jgi:hypothetical protein